MNVHLPPPETIQKLKTIGLVAGVGLVGLFGLAVIFDNSGSTGSVSILEKPIETQQASSLEPSSLSQPSQQVSATREAGWKNVETQCGAIALKADEVETELNIARAQKWLSEAQTRSLETGEANMKILGDQLTIYGAELQKINNKGLDQLGTNAKTAAKYRETSATIQDISKALTLLRYGSTPRPTVGFGEYKEQLDGCTDAITNYQRIEKEEWSEFQNNQDLSAPAINGGAKATELEGDENASSHD